MTGILVNIGSTHEKVFGETATDPLSVVPVLTAAVNGSSSVRASPKPGSRAIASDSMSPTMNATPGDTARGMAGASCW